MQHNQRERFLELALSYVGYSSTPFLGATTPTGPDDDFSCSGFICHLADILRISRPTSKFTELPVRTSREMFLYWGMPVPEGYAQPGDIVVFSNNGALVSHAGIYLGNDTYLHSPGTKSGKVHISPIDGFNPRQFTEENYYSLSARQHFDVVFRQNPVGFNRIF